MNQNEITIFTDGSSRGNPGRGGYAFIAAYPDSKGQMHVDEGGGKQDGTTNNQMEITAAIEALKHFDGYLDKVTSSDISFHIHSDSAYVINGITKWIFGWEKNGWKTSFKEDVMNVDLWKNLKQQIENKKITWHLVKGHQGLLGNERCDEIATSFADSISDKEKEPVLFRGPFKDYGLDLFAKAPEGTVKKSKSSKPAYSYVSLLDSKVMTHKTWEECEKRVKGQKGAKFKKVFSKAEEAEFIKKLENL